MKRKVITIDEAKCTGCGECIPGCPEGAIAMVDGKAKLVSEVYCDGLGACLGNCPEGAITVEERDAEAYDERAVIRNIMKQGAKAVAAHLEHLREHGELEYLRQAEEVLKETPVPAPQPPRQGGCPGSMARAFVPPGLGASALTHWPVQLHLLSPDSPHFKDSELLLASDCVAFALPDFQKHLRGKKLAILCPKLDQGKEIYVSKLQALIDRAQVKSITVMMMQVPCCGGTLQLVRMAQSQAARQVPVRQIVVGINGAILSEEEV